MATLYQQVRGLGEFRNSLIGRYLGIDPREVYENFARGLAMFPAFARQALAWLEGPGQAAR